MIDTTIVLILWLLLGHWEGYYNNSAVSGSILCNFLDLFAHVSSGAAQLPWLLQTRGTLTLHTLSHTGHTQCPTLLNYQRNLFKGE